MNYDDDIPAEEKEHLEIYKKLYKKYPVLGAAEQIELVVKAKNGDKRAGDKVVYHNLRLIVNIAKKHMGRGIPLGDLVHEGAMGMLKAITKFDPAKGFKFSTYATWWVRQGITRAIENKAKMIRIPSHKQQATNKIKWAYRQILEERAEGDLSDEIEKGSPSAKELAKKVNMTEEQVAECGQYMKDHVSLSQLVNEDENITLEDYIGADIDDQPEEQIEQSVDRAYVESVLSYLTEEEQSFVRYRFGFVDGITRTSRQMSVLTHLSPTENARKEEQILTKLRELLKKETLNSYANESK